MVWNSIDCIVAWTGDSITVKNRFAEPSDMQLSTEIPIKEGQNFRLTVEVLDYVADVIQDSSIAHTTVKAFLDYGYNI